MLKSKWTQFIIALFVGSSLGYFFIGREAPKQTPVGKLSIPNLEFFQLKNDKVSFLQDYKGKTVLVSFWASWCEPCKKEIPELVELKKRLANENLEILLVNEDEDKALGEKFLADLKLDFSKLKLLYDKDFSSAQKLQLESIPSSFLIDRAGYEVFSSRGYVNWLEKAALNLLTSELEKK